MCVRALDKISRGAVINYIEYKKRNAKATSKRGRSKSNNDEMIALTNF